MPAPVPMPMQRGFALLISLALALAAMVPLVAPSPARASSHVWINEIHYDNVGGDTGEAIEVAGAAGTDLSGWILYLYNGSNGTVYATVALNGALPDQGGSGFGTLSFTQPGIQNGSPDGVALVAPDNTVVQFLSYEGDFTALEGPAAGMDSTDIEASQDSAPVGKSLQLTGGGASYVEFDWIAADQTFGQPNVGQSFVVGLVVAGCGSAIEAADGSTGSTTVSGSDSNGIVTSITITSVVPSPTTGTIAITSFTPATAAGGVAEATVTVDPMVPVGTYQVTITASNGDEPAQTDQCVLAVTVFDATQIAEIQGAGHISPMADTAVFAVEGVVTAVRGFGRTSDRGFWMTDPTPDADALTSDGIFVRTAATPTVDVMDLVRVDGTAAERRPFFEDLTITEIANPTVEVVDTIDTLPSPVTVGVDVFAPTTVIDDDSTGSVEHSDAVYDPENDGIDFWETMEGTRVAVADAVAVGPTNNFGEIAVISQNQASAGEFTARGGLIVRDLSTTGNYQGGDFNPERLLLDDAFLFPAGMPQLNVGDEFATDPVGVLDQSFGAFKLLVTEDPGRVDNELQRETAIPAGPQELAVATFNVENLSARDCANDPDKVAGLADQIVNSLKSPDLIAIEEMQDNSGDEDDSPNGDNGVVVSEQSWQCLIDAIAAIPGAPVYDYRQIDPENNADGGVPGGNIRVGFLFHSERGLEFVDRPGGDAVKDTDVLPTPNGKGAQLEFSPGRVLDTPDGMETAWFETRKSLAGEFRFRGETVFVIANHFSSKGDDRPLYSTFQPPFRLTEFQSGGEEEDGWRHAQAQTINNFVDEILAIDEDAHVIVLGDINDFDFSETVKVLTGERVAVAAGDGVADPDGSGPTEVGGDAVLRTLFDKLPENQRYSYVFEGNSQVLDQILVSGWLFDNATYDVVHVNAEFADQVSDHDPSVMRVAFQPRRGH